MKSKDEMFIIDERIRKENIKLKVEILQNNQEIEKLSNIIKQAINYIEIVYDYLLVDKNFIDDDLRQKQKEIKDLMKILKSGDE